MKPSFKIGDLSDRGVFLNWLNVATGERGQGWFDLDTLCRLGYGAMHIDENLVVHVESQLVRQPA